jgi:hypothetical protein
MSSDTSEQFDYSGLEDHLKRQQDVASMRDAKFGSLYSGDVASSMAAGSRIRELVDALRANAPGTTERRPLQIVNPLSKVASRSTESSTKSEGGIAEFEKKGGGFDVPNVQGGAGGGRNRPHPNLPPQNVIPAGPAGNAAMRQADEDAVGILPDNGRRKPRRPLLDDAGEMIA